MELHRSSGILLHLSSLPGMFGIGDVGASAYHFVDWLVDGGQSLWQLLPLCPIGYGNSPYMALSAFAAEPLFIDLVELKDQGWLAESDLQFSENNPHRVDYERVTSFKMKLLRKASQNFRTQRTLLHQDFEEFCSRESYWLEDYSLFQTLNEQYEGIEWTSWESSLVRREKSALEIATKEFQQQIDFHKFIQWNFFRQFKKLKNYANERGIQIIGDLPIFVAHHSADVWANQHLFYLDEDGNPTFVAGVPPDYFSKTGQRWGNPLYRWDVMKSDGYAWWISRFKKALELYDIIRIDHFRGFESYWEIPAEEETAINGVWRKGPGEKFFTAVQQQCKSLQIIAEDLGIITKEVHALRKKLGYPGMRVLQFAFSGGTDNEYLPHRYERNTIVYTGTHDNDTTRGWYEKASEHERDFVRRYCQTDGHEIHWDLIRLALMSIADFALIPFQDVLGMDSSARMNTPGTVEGNWCWRFSWDQVPSYSVNRLCELSGLYERCSPSKLHLL